MIAHDRRTAENAGSDRQRLYRKHFSAIGQSWAILLFSSDSSEPAIVSDHIETKL